MDYRDNNNDNHSDDAQQEDYQNGYEDQPDPAQDNEYQNSEANYSGSPSRSGSKSLICPLHQQPIRGVCLDGQSPYKTVCGKCFKEIPRDLLVHYLDLQDFLTPGRKFEFGDSIAGAEHESQRRHKLLKDFMGTVDLYFQHYTDQITAIKDRFKENLKRRFEYENDALLRIVKDNTRMNSLIKKLRTSMNIESLTQAVNDHIEITKLMPIHSKLDGSKFNHFASEKLKQCSLQLDISKNLIEKVVLIEDLHYHSPTRSPSDHSILNPKSPLKNSSLLKSPKFSLHEANKAFNDPFHVAPLRNDRGEKSMKLKNSRGLGKKINLKDSLVSSFETVDTRLKGTDSIEFLPEQNMLALGGTVRGDHFHKILLMKIDPELSAFRMINAHSSVITKIVAGKNVILSSSRDKLLKAWDLVTFENIFALRHITPVFGMAFDEEEGKIYSFGEFRDIRVWDFSSRKELKSLHVETERLSQIVLISLSKEPHKKFIAAACSSTDKIFIIDVDKNRIVMKINEHLPIGNCDLKFVGEQNLLVNTSIGGHVRLWNLNKAEPSLIAEPVNFGLENHVSPVVNMAVGDQDGLVLLVNATREIMITSFKEMDLKAVIKFDEDEKVQHSRLLYLSDRRTLYSIDKFTGKISIIGMNGMMGYGDKSGFISPGNMDRSYSLAEQAASEQRT